MRIAVRLSGARGYADHGWLKTFHSFSFADYRDSRFDQFGPLRVINEDHIRRGRGFPEHPHRDFEIWTYVLRGELTHTDSLGNKEVMRAGDVQYTSAGTGVRHSEYNYSDREDAHIVQIWAVPEQNGLQPQYYTRHHAPASKANTLVPVVLPAASFAAGAAHKLQDAASADPIPIPARLSMFACVLQPGSSVTHRWSGSGSGKKPMGYVHLIMESRFKTPAAAASAAADEARLSIAADREDASATLSEGDAAMLTEIGGQGASTTFTAAATGKAAHFLLFDMS